MYGLPFSDNIGDNMKINFFAHNPTAYKAAITMLTERRKTAIIHSTGT